MEDDLICDCWCGCEDTVELAGDNICFLCDQGTHDNNDFDEIDMRDF